MKPFTLDEIERYMIDVPGWNLTSDEDPSEGLVNANPEKEQALNGARIYKEFKFKDFIGAINFVNLVADIAEMEGHHPDIHINYNKVLLELWTHAIGGLSENDFILAAKIDAHKV